MARLDVLPPELARRLDEQSLWVVRRMRGRVPISLSDLDRIAAALEIPVADFLPAPERVA
jgi:transcriptional regulator with XRE-family HTH domain